MKAFHNCFIRADEIYLRPHVEKDIERWFCWFNDAEVTDGMNKGFFPNTQKKQNDFFTSMYDSEKNLQLAIVLNENEQLIGTIGLHDINFIHKTADISVLVGEKESWGMGHGKQAVIAMIEHAFKKLCLYKVTSGMYAVNDGSRKLFESLGFVREAVFRQQVAYRSGRVDVYKYGLFSSEWDKSC